MEQFRSVVSGLFTTTEGEITYCISLREPVAYCYGPTDGDHSYDHLSQLGEKESVRFIDGKAFFEGIDAEEKRLREPVHLKKLAEGFGRREELIPNQEARDVARVLLEAIVKGEYTTIQN